MDEKTYVQSSKKWRDFEIHPEIIEVLRSSNKTKPTRIQQETLLVTTNPDRKKYSMIVRSSNGSGKTFTYLIPILNSLQPGLPVCRDKTVPGGKVQKDEIFLPQGVILVQTAMLMQQIEEELMKIQKEMLKFDKKPEKLNFTIGRMDKSGHVPGDIILTMPKSFLNRYNNKSLRLDNCNFLAIDQVDEIYEQGAAELESIMKICEDSQKLKLLVCSATMKKDFKEFFNKNSKNCLEINLNEILSKEIGHSITLEGVSNYIHVIDGEPEKYQYIINEVFNALYNDSEKVKPKVFIFFNSVDEIEAFKKLFDETSRDLMNPNSKFLQKVSVGVIAGYRKVGTEKKQISIENRRKVITDFRNGEFRVLLATNIVARGIDIRDVCFVINVDAPREGRRDNSVISIDTYLHRVGRTGRHSDTGVALTLVNHEDEKNLVDSVKKIHKVDIKKLASLKDLSEEVENCIKTNSQANQVDEKPAEKSDKEVEKPKEAVKQQQEKKN